MGQVLLSPAGTVLEEMARHGAVLRPSGADQVPKTGQFVYLVANRSDVLQLGKGDGARVRKCARGGLAGKHNKAFICAVGELVLGGKNSYALVDVGSKERASEVEGLLHRAIGVATNRDGATLIAGIPGRSIGAIHQGLWTRVRSHESYQMLDAVERQMADELFEVVTYATIKIRRTSGRVISSCQGDNLEGNILQNAGRCHLTNVFSKLTGQYLRYGKHLLSPTEFAARKADYVHSSCGGRPFVISNVPGLE